MHPRRAGGTPAAPSAWGAQLTPHRELHGAELHRRKGQLCAGGVTGQGPKGDSACTGEGLFFWSIAEYVGITDLLYC